MRTLTPALTLLAAALVVTGCNDGRDSFSGDVDLDALDGSGDVMDGSGDAGDVEPSDVDADDAGDLGDTLVPPDTDVADGEDATDDSGDAAPTCGDGEVQDGEDCDDGADNSDSRPDACRTDCTAPVCGDGVIDTGELCDDGNDVDGDGCESTCETTPSRLCTPCVEDVSCGDGGACVVLPTGSFCGEDCEGDGDCPELFRCAIIDRSGESIRQCVPRSLECEPCIDPDEDGYGSGPECAGLDCDQDNPEIFAGAEEVCDGEDNDCDGQVDEPGATGEVRFFADLDGDGFGDPDRSVLACGPAGEFTADNGDDCDDTDGRRYPGAEEVCDGADNDCDAATGDAADDDRVGAVCDGADSDLCQNGVGVCEDGAMRCREEGPAILEVCDGRDNDCDGDVDEDVTDATIGAACDGADADLCTDGAIVCASGELVCADATDDHVEVCDGEDNDCDGDIDEGLGETWYPDVDRDGWGVEAGAITACERPGDDWATKPGDCAPNLITINPDALELCDDGRDNDCNLRTDCEDIACGGVGDCDPLPDEDCDNGEDDDGDGATDCADTDCVLGAICCPADIFEPNTGTTGSPSTTWDDYQADADETLTISSTDVDSFRVPVCYGARVTVVARFSHADVDLDLRIRWPRGSIWQQSTSNTDNERIEATVDQLLDGTTLVDRVFVQAYVAEANQCGSYTLDISVDRSGCAF